MSKSINKLASKLLGISLKLEEFKIAEFDETVYIKRMNGHERQKYVEAYLAIPKDGTDANYVAIKPLLISLTICNKEGDLLFEDIEHINNLDSIVIDRLADKIMDVNGLTKASRADIEKKAADLIGSGTSLPSTSATSI